MPAAPKIARTLSCLAALLPVLAPALCYAADAPVPNKGDTAWMLTSTAFVLLMSVPALARVLSGEGKRIMDALRAHIASMQDTQARALASELHSQSRARLWSSASIIGVWALALLLVLVLIGLASGFAPAAPAPRRAPRPRRRPPRAGPARR